MVPARTPPPSSARMGIPGASLVSTSAMAASLFRSDSVT
jgi:hypothetical protein